jgi:hypothetical protein
VLHALRKAGKVEDSVGENESDNMERLRDGQVKLGGARHEHYARSQTNCESDENWYYEPPHAFECTREKIGALMGIPRVQE